MAGTTVRKSQGGKKTRRSDGGRASLIVNLGTKDELDIINCAAIREAIPVDNGLRLEFQRSSTTLKGADRDKVVAVLKGHPDFFPTTEGGYINLGDGHRSLGQVEAIMQDRRGDPQDILIYWIGSVEPEKDWDDRRKRKHRIVLRGEDAEAIRQRLTGKARSRKPADSAA